ncbi:MAG: hypothetical protein ACE15B_19410 [Bryobacteraceae bacterium]
MNDVHKLRVDIMRFRDELLRNPQRTEADDMVVEASMVLADLLIQYERKQPRTTEDRHASRVKQILRSYNAINHQRAVRDNDVEALEVFREPFSGVE